MMTVAGELRPFRPQSYADLPANIEHAEMLGESTIASAALGSTIVAKIIRALEVERGASRSDAWFGTAEKLPVAAAARVTPS